MFNALTIIVENLRLRVQMMCMHANVHDSDVIDIKTYIIHKFINTKKKSLS